MSVISTLVAQPNRIIVASEFVHGFGEKGAAMEDIEKMLSPLPPQQSQTDGSADAEAGGSGATTIARGVLSEMLRLKILGRTESEHLRVCAPLSAHPPKADWAERLHAYLFPLLTAADAAREHGQEELPEALCWLLQQNPTLPLGFSGGQHYNILASQMVENDSLCDSIRSDARYQNAVYWARYLGLAERLTIKPSSEKVIADPTRAITYRLPAIFSDERQLSMQTFLQRLGAQVPVLDGGQVWHDIQARLKGPMQAQEKHVSQATSLALLRLEHAGKIKLEGLSDAASWVLEVGRETKSISHITYLENSK
jgi:hypothetical protein